MSFVSLPFGKWKFEPYFQHSLPWGCWRCTLNWWVATLSILLVKPVMPFREFLLHLILVTTAGTSPNLTFHPCHLVLTTGAAWLAMMPVHSRNNHCPVYDQWSGSHFSHTILRVWFLGPTVGTNHLSSNPLGSRDKQIAYEKYLVRRDILGSTETSEIRMWGQNDGRLRHVLKLSLFILHGKGELRMPHTAWDKLCSEEVSLSLLPMPIGHCSGGHTSRWLTAWGTGEVTRTWADT